jgi:RNA polymerase sigma factor (sigma-70 family)
MAAGLDLILYQIAPGSGGLADDQLLGRFVATRDEVAFAVLVRRHGPMVLAVCRRILRDFQHAEDAYQATFLVLARKAPSLVVSQSLGTWLHGVAYHTAMRAGATVGRLRARERSMNDVQHPAVAPVEAHDWLPILDRELGLLPEKYRAAIVLCDLEGRPRREAALLLGVSEGTLSSRLARGRGLLGKRLEARGVALSVGALASVLSPATASAHAPTSLVLFTVRAAALVAAGQLPSASTPAVLLMSGEMKAMLLTKFKIASAVALAAACALVPTITWFIRSEANADETRRVVRRTHSVVQVDTAPDAPSRLVAHSALVQPDNEPGWKATFRKAYGLKDGEVIRRVPPPYPECRAEYFRDMVRDSYKRAKTEPTPQAMNKDYSNYFTKLGWKDGWTVGQFLMQRVPVKPDEGVTLGSLVHMTTGFRHTRTAGAVELLDRKVTGDFIVLAGADPGNVVAALEKILRKDCNLPVALVVKEAERDVFVLSGKYEARPLADRQQNQIEVYASELTDRNFGGGGSGTMQEMADLVEAFVSAPIDVGEILESPNQVQWHFNFRSPFTAKENAEDTVSQAVMNNIAAQTGLSVKREKRKIKVLEVKSQEKNQ